VTLAAAELGETIRFSVTGGGGASGDDGRAQLAGDFWTTRVVRNAPELVALALARAVVVAHGGRVTVDPVSTTVHLDVPAAPPLRPR
jgi:hypothetical protein